MYEKLKTSRKSGDEHITQGPNALDLRVLDFWQWASSDLVGNTLRGQLAEFLVAHALGVAKGVRNEWDPYDLETTSGLRIEVKSASFLQSWAQKRASSISFGIRETLAWDRESNTFESETQRRRQADVYVFALLAHMDKATLNPLDLSQWEFFVLETAVLDEHAKGQRSLTLSRLRALQPHCCSYPELGAILRKIELELRRAARASSAPTLS